MHPIQRLARKPLFWTLVVCAGALWLGRASSQDSETTPVDEAERRLEDTVRQFGRTVFGHDLRGETPLRQVAREHSLVLAAGGDVPTQEFLRRSQSLHGVLDPFPYVFYASGPASNLAVIEARLLESLKKLDTGEHRLFTHVAAGVVETKQRRFFLPNESHYFLTVLLTQRALSFAPLPHEIRPGDRILFEGEIHAPFRKPRILLTRPDGNTSTLENYTSESNHFRTYIHLDQGPGEYQLEVLGRYDLGPRVLGLCSLFPLEPGETSAHDRLLHAARQGTLEPSRYPRPRSPASQTEREAEILLLQLVNRDRERSGLLELVEDPDLSAMARAHSVDMRDHDFFAHVSPQTGTLADRARVAGIRYRRLGENIAVDNDVVEAEAALLRSPGHRMNILNSEFKHVGLGVAFEIDSNGKRRVFVTQAFLVPPS